MPRPGQHLKCHGYTSRCTYQMQSPTKEAPTLCCTPAKVGTCPREGAVDLATSPGSDVLAHRYRYAVYDECFSLRKHLPQHLQYVLQPPCRGKGVRSSAEARYAD